MIENQEPTLDELLREPIIRLVMVRDGVRPDEVRTLMDRARSTIAHENVGIEHLFAEVQPRARYCCAI